MTLRLADLQPFARGGNRLCYVHPEDSGRCIKVRRPDFTLEDRRRKKGFPKNLRPLSSFDDNLEEFAVMAEFERHFDDTVFAHISRCYGFVDSDMGRGLCSELIRDADQQISISLKQFLWDEGYTPACRDAVEAMAAHWQAHLVPSRDLLVHNIVVQRDGDAITRLVVIDGLGSSGLLAGHRWPRALRRRRVASKIANLHSRIDELLACRERGEFPGTHGLLYHRGEEANLGGK